MRKRETHESGDDGGHGAAPARDQGDGGMMALLRLMQAQQEQQLKWMQGQQEEQEHQREEQERRREEQERRREDLERQCKEQERRQREQERGQAEQREMLRGQMDALRSMLERTSTPGGGVSTGGARSGDPAEHIKLTRLTETDDVEAYLTTFERLMQLGRIAEESWTLRLAPPANGEGPTGLRSAECHGRYRLPDGEGGDTATLRHQRRDLLAAIPERKEKGGGGLQGAGGQATRPGAQVDVGV